MGIFGKTESFETRMKKERRAAQKEARQKKRAFQKEVRIAKAEEKRQKELLGLRRSTEVYNARAANIKARRAANPFRRSKAPKKKVQGYKIGLW